MNSFINFIVVFGLMLLFTIVSCKVTDNAVKDDV